MSWQAGHDCFKGLVFCESLSPLVLMGATGKVAVVSHSDCVADPCDPGKSMAYADALAQEWVLSGKASWHTNECQFCWRSVETLTLGDASQAWSSVVFCPLKWRSYTCINLELTMMRMKDTCPRFFVLKC